MPPASPAPTSRGWDRRASRSGSRLGRWLNRLRRQRDAGPLDWRGRRLLHRATTRHDKLLPQREYVRIAEPVRLSDVNRTRAVLGRHVAQRVPAGDGVQDSVDREQHKLIANWEHARFRDLRVRPEHGVD